MSHLCNVDIAEDMRVTGWRDECELTVYACTLECVYTSTSGQHVRIVWTVWIMFTGQEERLTCVSSFVCTSTGVDSMDSVHFRRTQTDHERYLATE